MMTRTKAKIMRSTVFGIVFFMILSISMVAIYKYYPLSKSDVVLSIKLNCEEADTKQISSCTINADSIEESNVTIVLPDKIEGKYVKRYYIEKEENIILEEKKEVEVVEQQEEITNGIKEVQAIEKNVNTEESINIENIEDVEQNVITEEISNNEITNEEILTEEVSNEIVSNTETEKKEEVIENVQTVENVTEEKNEIKPENNENKNEQQENVIEEQVEQLKESEKNESETVINVIEFVPGDKYLLTRDEVEKAEINLKVEYDIKQYNDTKLYKQKITNSINQYIISVDGYLPENSEVSVFMLQEEDIKNNEKLEKEDVLVAYDIKILTENGEFEPTDFDENVSVSISGITETNLLTEDVEILHISNDNNKENVEIIEKKQEEIIFNARSFSVYALVRMSSINENVVNIDDSVADLYYYKAQNNLQYVDSNTYTEQNLVEVTLNYYGYENGNQNAEMIGYVSLTERQNLYAYHKYYPITDNQNNKVTIELIDNPFSDRPTGYGFAGWNSTDGTISKNAQTNVESITANITKTNGKPNELVINLYAKWERANVIYVSNSTGSDTYDGLTEETAVGSWGTALQKLKSSSQDTNNREKNILVMCGNMDYTFNYTTPVTIEKNGQTNYTVQNSIASGSIYLISNSDNIWNNNAHALNGNNSVGDITLTTTEEPEETARWRVMLSGNGYIIQNEKTNQYLSMNNNTLTISNAPTVWTYENQKLYYRNGNTTRYLRYNNGWTTSTNQNSSGTTIYFLTYTFNETNSTRNVGDTTTNNNYSSSNNIAFTLTSQYGDKDYKNSATWNLSTSTTNYHDVNIYNDFVLENVNISANGYTQISGDNNSASSSYPIFTGNCNNVRLGRGLKPNSTSSSATTFQLAQGGYRTNTSTGSTSNDNNSYRFVVESGVYSSLQAYHIYGSSSSNYYGQIMMVLGNDYDRVSNNNNNLNVYYRTSSNSGDGINGKNDVKIPAYIINVKSGTFGMNYFDSYRNSNSEYYAYAGIYVGGYGVSSSNSTKDISHRNLIVEGGKIANIVGGLRVEDGTNVNTNIFVKGGIIENIVGGAGRSTTHEDRNILVTGGIVEYSISGGSNGYYSSSSSTGEINGSSLVFVGGNAQIGTETTKGSTLYGVQAGSVLGAGNGLEQYKTTAGRVETSHVIIADEAQILNSVYGGGNYGIVKNDSATTDDRLCQVEYTNESLVSGENYIISNGNGAGSNAIFASGNSIENKKLLANSDPTTSAEWQITSSGSGYTIKNVSTGQYLTTQVTSSFFSSSVSLSFTSNPEVWNYSNGGFYRAVTTSSWWNQTTNNYYIAFSNNDWNVSTSTQRLYFLKYKVTYEENEQEEDEITISNPATKVEILGGNINSNVYGGANNNHIYGSSTIYIKGGQINGTVYGGSNLTGDINGHSLIKITGGNIGQASNSKETETIFVGGYGESTNITNDAILYIYDKDNNVNIYGSCYCGSSLGKVLQNTIVSFRDNPDIANSINIKGRIFGGGKGNNTISARNGGNTDVSIEGGNNSELSIFGGNDINGITVGNINVKIGEKYSTKLNEVYGGGNQADITTSAPGVYVKLHKFADVKSAFNGGKSADLLSNISNGEIDSTRKIEVLGAKVDSVYGGSNESGTVTTSNIYCESGNINNIYGGNNLGGQTVNSHIDIIDGNIQNVYGGGNQANTTKTNVIINKGTIQNIFGGGKAASVENSNVYVYNGNISNVYGGSNESGTVTTANIFSQKKEGVENNPYVINVFGGNNQGGLTQNSNINITNGKFGTIYGGGNNAITGQTNVNISKATIEKSIYGGGNGSAAVVNNNTNLVLQDNVLVGESVFGGGNQAVTGNSTNNNSVSTVNIVGAKIGQNVYGGANTSVVYGYTKTNIGFNAVNNPELVKSDIEIKGTVFGGGEANAEGSETYDFSYISVTKGIDINIDASNYDKFDIYGSIFGSGNASSTSGYSNILIKDYGTRDLPKTNISLQRADVVTLDNSSIWFSGTTDRTNEYSDIDYTVSRVDDLKIKNNSTLYLKEGANLLKKYESLVDVNGKEEKEVVTIEDGKVEQNVDNRIYMKEGKNLNIATNEQASAYGEVCGMTFFGVYTGNYSVSTGMYKESYKNGDNVDAIDIDIFTQNSYVIAQHYQDIEHDITVDGFFTNYIEGDEESDQKTILVDYITPTPSNDTYYMWYTGVDADVTVYNFDLTASRFATLGTYELALIGFSEKNIKFEVKGFSTDLVEGINLIDKTEIATVEDDEAKANSVFGLVMKTGNNGWQMNGETNFYTGQPNYSGTGNYLGDSSTYTPTLNFCLYHSKNLTVEQDLGQVTVVIDAITQIDDLNKKVSKIFININLATKLFQDNYYEAGITPGNEYGLFTTTDTNITQDSSYSTYYALYMEEFSKMQLFNGYQNYHRTLVTDYVYPKNTTITMIDLSKGNPKYYYYVVSESDENSNKMEFNLSEFLKMGSVDEHFYEDNVDYYNSELDIEYEEFIFQVNFSEANIPNNVLNKTMLIELRNSEEETLVGVLGIQRDTTIFSIYNNDATIDLTVNSSNNKFYLGTEEYLYVKTDFNQKIVGSKMIYDTGFFDEKLGVKISLYDNNGKKVTGSSLLGVHFQVNGKKYYPRTDGSTRIKLADKFSNVEAYVHVYTENSTLASGDYTIKVESFSSPDGEYYGIESSASKEIPITIINEIYGLNSKLEDSEIIIDKETGNNLNDKNELNFTVEYSSGLRNPNITVSLYRRDYSDTYSKDYTLVNLQDYVQNTLKQKYNENEYEAISKPVSSNRIKYNLNPNLMTGTYKVVFSLYDEDNFIGDVYSYIVIK